MIDNSDIKKVARYFDVSSGYIPNQFEVRIYKEGIEDTYQENASNNGKPFNRLYLINSEPWVVEDITFPQIKLTQNNDIYVDSDSLIKPNYITGVETSGIITMTVREKSDLAIYRALVTTQAEMYTSKYEYSGRNLFGENYRLEIREFSQRFDANVLTNATYNGVGKDNVILFDRVILAGISDPKLAYSDRSFMRYTVTFETSSMAESYLALATNKPVKRAFNIPSSNRASGTANNKRDNKAVNSRTRSDYGLPVPTFLQSAVQGMVQAVAAPIIASAMNNMTTGINKGITDYANEKGSATITDSQIQESAGTNGLDITSAGSDMIQQQIDSGVSRQSAPVKWVLGQ